MTPEQIALVQSSFRQVAPIADRAAVLFYARLFELDPSLRRLFHGDMTEQGNKLKATDFLDKVASVCGNTTCREYAELKAVIGGARIY